MASNSSGNHPAPTPMVNRPLDGTPIVERIFAVSTAGHYDATITDVTRRRRDVFAARMAISVNCSCRPPRAPCGNSPVSE
jgi:hypothetical protein